MNKLFSHIIAGVIPNKQLRRRVREKFLGKDIASRCSNEHLYRIPRNECNDSNPTQERLKYYSCDRIENFGLILNYVIGMCEKPLKFCCEPIGIGNIPGAALCGTAEESINALFRERANVIEESKRLSLMGKPILDEERKYTSGCAKCVYFQLKNWEEKQETFSFVNLSIYPSPCQCKCIYCNVRTLKEGSYLDKFQTEDYEKILDLLEWASNKDMISANATWQISSGEITIHPYKERILNLVKGKKAKFCSNCFIFDEKIAANLAENPDSQIELSIDCGTPETWRKVKGVDNFDVVINNLCKYHANTTKPGQIQLKYIIMPGINDGDADYKSVIEIMKKLDVGKLYISRNLHLKYARENHDALIKATGRIVAMLRRERMGEITYGFSSTEWARVTAFANEST